jgi:hypothetical protein
MTFGIKYRFWRFPGDINYFARESHISPTTLLMVGISNGKQAQIMSLFQESLYEL